MDPSNHLKSLLQTQLASDASAVRHLPYCLSTLSVECLKPSAQSTKWTNRINSLLHSKESGARWAGLCLAYKSSLLSQSMMIDAAQSWIIIALPLLSRNELLPTVKAAVRLLRVIFSTAIDISEFQRQISLPHIVKFTSALIPLTDNHTDVELKTLCMETLTRLIPLYPTTHRSSSSALSAFTLRYLNGSATGHTNENILNAASRLYAVLPLTGGKVGATTLWRKSLDETLAFGWEAFYSLRTTFPFEGQASERPTPADEPQVNIPLCLDRLRCSIVILSDLIRSTVERPVQIPVGKLLKFVTSLLTSSFDEEAPGFVDPIIRSIEVASLPDIWKAGCELLVSLANQFPHRLNTNAGRLLSILAYHLEHVHDARIRLTVIKTINVLLQTSHPLHSTVLPNRLVKAILPLMTPILTTSQTNTTDAQASSSKSKNAKKRARNYEGDEVFQVNRKVVCPTAEDEEILLTSLDVTKALFNNPELSSSLYSLIARIITSMLLGLPRTSASSISQDPGFIHTLYAKIQDFSLDIGSGTTSVMSKTLPFVIESALSANDPQIQRDIALLLHPRVPPLVRSMPHLESISLFKAEQSQEEIDALAALEVKVIDPQSVEIEQEDIIMSDRDPLTTTASTFAAAKVDSSNTFTPISQQPKSAEPTPNYQKTPPIAESTAQVASHSEVVSGVAPKISSHPVVTPLPQEADEDEEMPAINMDSDSEDEGSQ